MIHCHSSPTLRYPYMPTQVESSLKQSKQTHIQTNCSSASYLPCPCDFMSTLCQQYVYIAEGGREHATAEMMRRGVRGHCRMLSQLCDRLTDGSVCVFRHYPHTNIWLTVHVWTLGLAVVCVSRLGAESGFGKRPGLEQSTPLFSSFVDSLYPSLLTYPFILSPLYPYFHSHL